MFHNVNMSIFKINNRYNIHNNYKVFYIVKRLFYCFFYKHVYKTMYNSQFNSFY